MGPYFDTVPSGIQLETRYALVGQTRNVLYVRKCDPFEGGIGFVCRPSELIGGKIQPHVPEIEQGWCVSHYRAAS